MTYQYWAEHAAREGEIKVFAGPSEEWAAHLSAGEAVQFYASYAGLKLWCAKLFPQADVWYTERNGDGIGMLVPRATDTSRLPSVALIYIAFEWIDPDKDFGSGVRKL
jgi:hypothetical protein